MLRFWRSPSHPTSPSPACPSITQRATPRWRSRFGMVGIATVVLIGSLVVPAAATHPRPRPMAVAMTTGSSHTGLGFTGEPQFPDATLFLRTRTYLPRLGRFAQPDPLDTGPLGMFNPAGTNPYAYANNSPTRYTDPSGNWVETVADVAGASLSVAAAVQDWQTNACGKWWSVAAAIVDVAMIALPGVPGMVGMVQRGNHIPPGLNQIPTPPTAAASPMLPPGLGKNGMASQIGDISGMKFNDFDRVLRHQFPGVQHSQTAGGYHKYKFPDKSAIWVGPDGKLDRIPEPRYQGPYKGARNINKGIRLNAHGIPVARSTRHSDINAGFVDMIP